MIVEDAWVATLIEE
jgi:hypothetical protein